jgi:uncharacterized membrane protein
MERTTQLGIAVAVLGGVIAFMGLFPGVIGLDQAQGVGIFQMTVILIGFCLLILGAATFVQLNYYAGKKHTLGQEIAVRLSMTGLIVSIVSGYADILGIGSHPPFGEQRPLLGTVQVIGLVGGFMLASIGVILFALLGQSDHDESVS